MLVFVVSDKFWSLCNINNVCSTGSALTANRAWSYLAAEFHGNEAECTVLAMLFEEQCTEIFYYSHMQTMSYISQSLHKNTNLENVQGATTTAITNAMVWYGMLCDGGLFYLTRVRLSSLSNALACHLSSH